MNFETAVLAAFSPTGTGKAVVERIARGLDPARIEWVDITRPDVRARPLRVSKNDLLIVVAPVYMGRIPALLGDWLNAVQADGTPTVCVVVYGNRVYGDALLELKDALARKGCVPVAAAAYIGEHSFSHGDLPIADGRPDGDDLAHAEAFGRKVRDKLQGTVSMASMSPLAVPGTYPYDGKTELWDVDFIAVDDGRCIHCGECVEACPTGAIDPDDGSRIDIKTCITCAACIKACPEDARSIKPGPVLDAAKRLNGMCKEPKQPETFL